MVDITWEDSLVAKYLALAVLQDAPVYAQHCVMITLNFADALS